MDKIEKLLKKITKKEKKDLLKIMRKIRDGQLDGLDVKKLKNHKYLYRVRVGTKRVIFIKESNQPHRIVSVENRSDTTYKF